MLKTFSKGGVHPPEKKITSNKNIVNIELPKQVTILLNQNLGAPSKSIVKASDKVKVGQKIAEAGGFVSANIHSSVSGTVVKIDKVPDASGYKRDAIIINVEGDEWDESIDKSTELKAEITLTPEEIINKIQEMGIVGLGGATFPTHVKLKVPQGYKAEYLIINAVECEPFLTSDHQLMLEKTEQIIVGTKILMKALGVNKAFIGIENNKPDAIKLLTEKLTQKQDNSIEVVALKVKYPQGGEKQLIKAITGREVPSGGLPIYVGCVVQNVGTAFAVYEAVQHNKPLFERVVTLTGTNVPNPGNYLLRIGTPLLHFIEQTGGLPENIQKIVNGGPMMGKAIYDISMPVTKGTSGILYFDNSDSKRKTSQPCIRCAKCVNVCPQGLEPYQIMNFAERKQWQEAEVNHNLDCIECGSCSYVCPASRPLLDYIRLGKQNVAAIIKARTVK